MERDKVQHPQPEGAGKKPGARSAAERRKSRLRSNPAAPVKRPRPGDGGYGSRDPFSTGEAFADGGFDSSELGQYGTESDVPPKGSSNGGK